MIALLGARGVPPASAIVVGVDSERSAERSEQPGVLALCRRRPKKDVDPDQKPLGRRRAQQVADPVLRSPAARGRRAARTMSN